MDAFLRTYRTFLLSSLYLLVGVLLLGYSVFYSPLEIASADATRLANELKTENDRLNKLVSQRNAADRTAVEGINSLPTFLNRINQIAKDTTVIIKELMPSRDSHLKFVLKISADYMTFLRFAAELESLNVSIHDLQVRPFNMGVNPPLHAIEFAITPRADAAPLSGDRITALKTQVGEPDKRNPFQRFAFNARTREVTPEIDLTWIHKLSGVGRSGDRRVATINNRDYGIGDKLEDMTITEVGTDEVKLTRKTADGTTNYVLRYRRSKLDKTQ